MANVLYANFVTLISIASWGLCFFQTGKHNTHFCLPEVGFCILLGGFLNMYHFIHFSWWNKMLLWMIYVKLRRFDGILQSLAAVKRLQPKKALLVGMTHEFDHDIDNEHLKEWSKRQAHQALCIPFMHLLFKR
jgi:hypothetical protein